MEPMKGQNKYMQEAGLKRGKTRSKLVTCDRHRHHRIHLAIWEALYLPFKVNDLIVIKLFHRCFLAF